MKKLILILCVLVLIGNLSALSNESFTAKEKLQIAQQDINEMVERGIGVNRVNESYQETYTLYLGQLALEQQGAYGNYKVVIQQAEGIHELKQVAIQASDELQVFLEFYSDLNKTTDLNSVEEEYNEVLASFEGERFEETLMLIESTYDLISNVQSSQTAVRAFYNATSKNLKWFFETYGLTILIVIVVGFVIVLIFWTPIRKYLLKKRLSNLVIQKGALNKLIKELQISYFKKQNISESEYRIKLEKFSTFIREINRQTMVLNEELYKVKKEKENIAAKNIRKKRK